MSVDAQRRNSNLELNFLVLIKSLPVSKQGCRLIQRGFSSVRNVMRVTTRCFRRCDTVRATRLDELPRDQAERENSLSRLNRHISRRVREKKLIAFFLLWLYVCFLMSRVPFDIAGFNLSDALQWMCDETRNSRVPLYSENC